VFAYRNIRTDERNGRNQSFLAMMTWEAHLMNGEESQLSTR
jgi:hypothetical protein